MSDRFESVAEWRGDVSPGTEHIKNGAWSTLCEVMNRCQRNLLEVVVIFFIEFESVGPGVIVIDHVKFAG